MPKMVWGIILAALFAMSLTTVAHAKAMKLTIYDDGVSCPAGCDAHVVINNADNGSINARRPGSQRAAPKPCLLNSACVICFDDNEKSCLIATYRGNGPPAGVFDFTPAFYAERCDDKGIPSALRKQCDSLDAAVVEFHYDKRLNCLVNPNQSACGATIEKAREAQVKDEPKRAQCLEMGQKAFNLEQLDPSERRANECSYSDLRLGGPNSHGIRWRKLLPASCRLGTFVGKDGLDCCSGDRRFAANVHSECVDFYPLPKP